MRDSSSTNDPLVVVSLYRRLSSSSFIFFVLAVTSSMSLTLSDSSSCFSVRITLPSSCSSNPLIVTVKSMMDVRAYTCRKSCMSDVHVRDRVESVVHLRSVGRIW